jgi:hypothetical protein
MNEVITLREPRALAGLAPKLPALFLPDEKTAERFFGFFTANIRNVHTRRAYYKAACRFADWCEGRGLLGLAQGETAPRRLYRGAAGRAGRAFGEAAPGGPAHAL